LSRALRGVTAGSDGNIWAGNNAETTGFAAVFKITPAGLYTTYPQGGYLAYASGPWSTETIYSTNGFVYFIAQPAGGSRNSGIVTQMTTDGAVAQQYSIPLLGGGIGEQYISSLTLGADGNLWLVDAGAETIDVWVLNPPASARARHRALR